jgi:hypothetical protein
MKKVIRLTESELIDVIEGLLNENYYDRDRLYLRDYIVARLSRAPRELKSYIKNLPSIPCKNKDTGEEQICTKIPEVVHVYLMGNY